MVGVPRSQGCRNCRRKKKGCDLRKPSCGQCVKLGLTCEWAAKQFTFVTQHPDSQSGASTRSKATPEWEQRVEVNPPAIPQERSLRRTTFQNDLIASFWEGFLPKDQSPSVGGIYAAHWVRTVWDLAELAPTPKLCLTAVVSMALGRLQGKAGLVQEGVRLYSNALRETNRALEDPMGAQSDATLASIKLLSMYENVRLDTTRRISTQGQDWHKHIDGLCHIVQMRGRENHVTQHGDALFEEARVNAIISGITRRRPNFFTAPAWHTIPWKTQPRNLRDELYDIMTALPDVLYKQDLLTRSLDSLEINESLYTVLTDAQNHINRCILIATSLREWERRALAACTQQSSPAQTDFVGPLSLLEICQDFGYGFFHTVMFYFTACMVLYGSVWIIKRNVMNAVVAAQASFSTTTITSASSSSNPSQQEQTTTIPTLMTLPSIPLWLNPLHAATSIAKAAPYYFSSAAGFWGPWTSTFPIGSALHYFAATGMADSEEATRLRALFKHPRLGSAADDFLRSIVTTTPSAVAKGGDPSDRKQFRAMASSWYGTDVGAKEEEGK